ncbi:hypothetical protein HY379_02085 [Candidatus Saccharibacteria bacterium]|nr:hypothetical protein [Candidatus Saccharibacteria bacterium]
MLALLCRWIYKTVYMIGRFDHDTVGKIHDYLSEAGLKRSADELVVVGGAAMAAYGIKKLSETDIDIAITDELMEHLSHDDRWKPASDLQQEKLVAVERGVIRTKSDPSRYAGLITKRGDITAITPPLEDSTYAVSNKQLIRERVVPEGWKYGFSPLARILDWKFTLAESPDYTGDREKHFADCRLITAYLLELADT